MARSSNQKLSSVRSEFMSNQQAFEIRQQIDKQEAGKPEIKYSETKFDEPNFDYVNNQNIVRMVNDDIFPRNILNNIEEIWQASLKASVDEIVKKSNPNNNLESEIGSYDTLKSMVYDVQAIENAYGSVNRLREDEFEKSVREQAEDIQYLIGKSTFPSKSRGEANEGEVFRQFNAISDIYSGKNKDTSRLPELEKELRNSATEAFHRVNNLVDYVLYHKEKEFEREQKRKFKREQQGDDYEPDYSEDR